MSPAPGPPLSCAPKASSGRGLLGLLHIATGNLLAFPDAAGFLRSMGSLPFLAQAGVFYIVFLMLEFSTKQKLQVSASFSPGCLSVFPRGFCTLAITNLHPNTEVLLQHFQPEVPLTFLFLCWFRKLSTSDPGNKVLQL